MEELSGIKSEALLGTCEHWKSFYSEERPCLADLLADGADELVPEWYLDKCSKVPFIEDAYVGTDFFPFVGEKGKWLHFTAAVIRDSKGMIVAVIETLEDITGRKQAEDDLRESHDLLEQRVAERTAQLQMELEIHKKMQLALQESADNFHSFFE